MATTTQHAAATPATARKAAQLHARLNQGSKHKYGPVTVTAAGTSITVVFGSSYAGQASSSTHQVSTPVAAMQQQALHFLRLANLAKATAAAAARRAAAYVAPARQAGGSYVAPALAAVLAQPQPNRVQQAQAAQQAAAQRALKAQFAMGFAALNGTPVMQGHVNYCAAHGHATHHVAGVLQPHCPRCGAYTAQQQQQQQQQQQATPVATPAGKAAGKAAGKRTRQQGIRHQAATLTQAQLNQAITAVLAAGANGPRFCNAPYVAGSRCMLATGHQGQHVTQGLRQLIGWQ